MPTDRTTTFCQKCSNAYKDKAHLHRCYPDKTKKEIDAEHAKEKVRMMLFTKTRYVESHQIKAAMKAADIPLSLLTNVSKLIGILGHTVIGTQITPDTAMSVPTTVPFSSPSTGSSDSGDTRDEPIIDVSDRVTRQSPSKANAYVDDGEVAGCSYVHQPLHLGDDDNSSDEFPDDAGDTSYKPPARFSVPSPRSGIRYNYANDPLRKKLMTDGLYQEIPSNDPLLQQYARHLKQTVQKSNATEIQQSLVKVARFFFYFQHSIDLTADAPDHIDVNALKNRHRCSDYFARLTASGMKANGVRQYAFHVKKFLDFLISSSQISDAEAQLVTRFMPALQAHISAVQKAVTRDQAAKNVANLVDPSMRPVSLQMVQRAYTDPKVRQDVEDAVSRAKAANEKRRSHQAMREVSSNDHRLVTRYLAGAVIQLCHFQRPGVAANMTVKEFALAMEVGDDGERLIAVIKHKTATSYPACMILSAADFQLMGDYLVFIRGEMPEDADPETSHFFRSPNGKPIPNMSKELERLQTGYAIVSKTTASGALGYTANHARKAMESASRQYYGNGRSAELKSVSDYLTHSENVVRKHYARKTFHEVMAARKCMMAVLNSDAPCHGGETPFDDSASESSSSACSSSAYGSHDVDVDQLDQTYRAIFENRFNSFDSEVPSLADVTGLLSKAGLKQELVERFSRRFIASWMMSRERHVLSEYFASVPTRPSTKADASALIGTLGLRLLRPLAVIKLAKSMPIPTTRCEKRATKQKQATNHDEWLVNRIRDQIWPGLVVRDSVASMGRGVCTTKPFLKGEVVCDYNGMVLQGQAARDYIKRADNDTSIDTSYMYTFKCQDVACVIDCLDEIAYGGMIGRYINHAVTPNLISKPMMISGVPVMVFVAASDILAGADLSFNYGDRSQSAPEWMHDPTGVKTKPTRKRKPLSDDAPSTSKVSRTDGRIPPMWADPVSLRENNAAKKAFINKHFKHA